MLQRSHFAGEPQKHPDADRQLVLEAKHGAESAKSVTASDDEELAEAMAARRQEKDRKTRSDANTRCLPSATPPASVPALDLDAVVRRMFTRSKLPVSVFEFLLQATQLAFKLSTFSNQLMTYKLCESATSNENFSSDFEIKSFLYLREGAVDATFLLKTD